MGASGQGTHYLYQPAGVHCGCGRKRLCSRSGCGAGMALGLGARAAVRCAAAEAPSSRWLGSAPPRATRRHLQDGKQLLSLASTASYVIGNTATLVLCAAPRVREKRATALPRPEQNHGQGAPRANPNKTTAAVA